MTPDTPDTPDTPAQSSASRGNNSLSTNECDLEV